MYNSLTNAHKGYEYQDLITGIALIKCLVKDWESVRIDKKLFAGDAFDDLVITTNSEIFKYQIKHSESRVLTLSSLSNSYTSYLLKDLVESVLKDPESCKSKYHLTTNWLTPSGDDLDGLILVSNQIDLLDLQCKSYNIDKSKVKKTKLIKWLASIEEQVSNKVKADIDIGKIANLTLHSGLPDYSSNLFDPGDLENVLLRLVIDSIGIGRYPHQHRNAEDFSAQVIKLATRARKDQREITKTEVEVDLQLITNFGRLPQEIPINKAVVQARESLQCEFQGKLKESKVHILRGGPGTGKSWFLSLLAESLSVSNSIIGKHHCYISPIDEDPRLATTQVAFANIAADILDQDRTLNKAITSKYSISIRELQELVDAASKHDQLILIIDGLDHLPRLLNRYPELSPIDTNLLEPFSNLVLPDNAYVIFGTQPGEQYDKITELYSEYNPVTHDIPGWSKSDINDLAIAYGVKPFGAFDEKYINSLLDTIVKKAEGNPLYATYIIKALLEAVLSGELASVENILSDLPRYNNDINVYYEHLLSDLGEHGSNIALLLAATPFAIESDEIEEILGPNIFTNDMVTNGLKSLSSVLTNQQNLSGIRIFHESFRRYVFEREDLSGSKDNRHIFDAVAGWLASLGFYNDPRTYTYLMRILASSSTPELIAKYIEPTFLEKSFDSGFNFSQMAENLRYSMSLACKLKNWKLIIRLIELNRALDSAEFNEFEFSNEFWEFGVLLITNRVASQKLLYEGKPYLSKLEGLKFCKLLHENGHIAPWDIYLDLDDAFEKTENDQDNHDAHKNEQELSLLKLYGECCIGNADNVVKRVIGFIDKKIKSFGSSQLDSYIKNIIYTLYSISFKEKYFSKVIDRLESLYPSANEEGKSSIQNLLFYAASLNKELWSNALLVKFVDNIEKNNDIRRSLLASSYGANISTKDQYHEIAKKCDFPENHPSENTSEVVDWLRSLDILTKNNEIVKLKVIAADIYEDSWFNLWKKYCLKIRVASKENDEEKRNNLVVDSLSLLSREISPFLGDPRSCDLYSYHNIISNEIIYGFNYISDRKHRLKAIIHVCKIIEQQSTSLSGSSFCPVTPETIALDLMQWPVNNETKTSIAYYAKWLKQYTDSSASYADYFRDRYAACAALYQHAGRYSTAKRIWSLISRFVFGYGMRKDTTYFEILSSIDAIKYKDLSKQEQDIQDVQEICESVVRHTDGRSTSSAPIEWFKAVSRIDVNSAAECLSKSYMERESYGWYIDEATIHIGMNLLESSSQLRAATLIAVPYIERTLDRNRPEHVINEINLIIETQVSNPNISNFLGSIFLAKLQGQTGSEINNHLLAAKKQLKNAGISIPETWRNDFKKTKNDNRTFRHKKLTDLYERQDTLSNLCVGSSDFPSIDRYIQKLRDLSYDTRLDYSEIINQLGYSFVELSESHDEISIIDYLYYFKKETMYSIYQQGDLFDELGDGFKRYNKNILAIHSYLISVTLSFSAWSDSKISRLLDVFNKAYVLNAESALTTLTNIISDGFHDPIYSNGWTSGLINLLRHVGMEKEAYESWGEAKEVIKRRLPTQDKARYFPKFEFVSNDISPDISLAKILLGMSKHPLLIRRYFAYNVISVLGDDEVAAIDSALCPYLATTCSTLDARIAFSLIDQIAGLGHNKYTKEIIINYSKMDYGMLSSLSKRLLCQKNKPKLGNLISYKPPIEYRSYWGTEAYISNYYIGIQKEYSDCLDNLRHLGEIKLYQKNRAEIAHHRTDREGEFSPVIPWHYEICETALDQALHNILVTAWKDGTYIQNIDKITYIINSLSTFEVSIGKALVPRPLISLPSESSSDFGDIEYTNNGWIRLAHVENEKQSAWTRHDNKGGAWLSVSFLVPSETTDITDILSKSLPVVDHIGWVNNSMHSTEYEIGSPLLSMLQLGNVSFNINAIVISPSHEKIFNLEMANPFDFKWYNSSGELVAYTNIWIERDPKSYHDDRPGLFGSELLICPALFSELKKVYGKAPVKYTCTFPLK